MLKLLPILFFAAVNVTQISIFEIEGIFSSGHINAIERYFDENKINDDELFIIQYNANDVSQESIVQLGEILESVTIPKAIWVGPNKTEINAELLKDFDFVGLSPGTLVTNMCQNTNEILFDTDPCLVSSSTMLVTGEEDIYERYMIVGSIGAFIENLGMEDISSNLDNSVNHDFKGKLPYSWPSVSSSNPLNYGDQNYQPKYEC